MESYKPTAVNRFILGAVLLLVIATIFVLISPYISADYLESQRSYYRQFYTQNPVAVVIIFMVMSALLMGAALPVTGLLMLLSGALFGFSVGVAASAIATTVGSTIGFIWARYLFRDFLESRYKVQLEIVNRGIEREGGYYVFSARLLMILPYFLVNLLCGLSCIKLSTYVVATFISQLIVASLLVYAGTQLATIDSMFDVLSPNVLLALGLIGVTPLISRRIFLWYRRR